MRGSFPQTCGSNPFYMGPTPTVKYVLALPNMLKCKICFKSKSYRVNKRTHMFDNQQNIVSQHFFKKKII
jgi:hypothetical protein